MDIDRKKPFPQVVDQAVIALNKQDNISLHRMEHASKVLQFTQIEKKNEISKFSLNSLFQGDTGEPVKFVSGMYFCEQHDVSFKLENGALKAVKFPNTEAATEFCQQNKIQFNHL